jgi:hypothetical protein
MASDEPMIDKENRPSAMDFDTPIADWRVRDLVALIDVMVEDHAAFIPIPEEIKPEGGKGEWRKPEIRKPEWRKPEWRKPEIRKPEARKPEKEILKEFLKPEQGLKPEPFDETDLIERIAQRTAEILRERG